MAVPDDPIQGSFKGNCKDEGKCKGKDKDGEIKMKPVDWAEGINAIADALRVNASLTKLGYACPKSNLRM